LSLVRSIKLPAEGRSFASRVRYLFKVLAAAAAFAFLFHFTDTKALGTALQRADYWIVAAGSAVFLFGQYLAAQRWRGVLKSGSVTVSRLGALRLNLIGTFVGNFLPGQGSGDLVKSTFLFRRFPDRRAFLLASVVYDRLLGVLAMLGLALAGVVVLGAVDGDWSMANVAGWSLLFIAGLVAAIRYLHNMQLPWSFLGEFLGKRFAGFSGQLVELFRNRRLFLRSFALSVVFQLSWVLALWLMLRAVQPSATLAPVLLAAPLAVLVATVPVSLGGLGIREGAFSLLLQRFGVNADVATAGALLSLVPLLIASLLGACLAFVWHEQGDGN
jgi:glycosyltransferase 2 family protein